ncbi:hypothetical protein KTR66_09660 [Roseococcus sp. SDR]|uniref:hypothetical protein n=1 Tax=Roseococcus sp. SDR TaxID=2835532 RepID=UPI001BCD7375|nr:hypothetical protein [Roseococcus sp. SDR]MBS7790262.1 hypothetical protein [Roseococcus sp. SDR]MBV1845576.1 hypothetical protein [Roseococcus sp. SDR]
MNAVTPIEGVKQSIAISPPDLRVLQMKIIGTAPLMVCKFATKAKNAMMEKQAAGSVAKKGSKRAAKDFDEAFQQARHISTEGWDGFAAGAIRNAMISACRLVGFKMTLAKLSVFVIADGFSADDGTPLIRIIGGEPERTDMPVRNATGVMDVRTRPMWREWAAVLNIRYDADQFSATDVMNLLARVGMQVGIGEGRPDSKQSAGMGFGTFEVERA